MFRTEVEIPHSKFEINHNHSIITLGSCFAENIGKKMSDVYFNVDVNPFGVLYNPVSVKNSLELLLQNKLFTENDLFAHRGLWQSFSHSSLFSDTTPEKCLNKINNRFSRASELLQKADFILITLGTAWVFEEQKGGRVVSNCHKLPAKDFVRRRLRIDEIVADYSKMLTELTVNLPNLKLIFSVSPIRHWKDGAHENTLSKSTLLLAIDILRKQFSNLEYFPAYEIMMDELRDYRFYASDMLHPSDVAVDYIWKRFSATYFDNASSKMNDEFEQLRANLSHRPLFPGSDEFQIFKTNLEKQKEILKTRYPFLINRLE